MLYRHQLAVHCHVEEKCHAETRENRSGMDIARRVGGHIAFGTEEGRVDSCLSRVVGCRLMGVVMMTIKRRRRPVDF